MQLCKLFKCYSNHFLISLSISDLEILAKRVSVLYAVVHGQVWVEAMEAMPSGRAQETATTILMRGVRRGNPGINSLNYCNRFPSSDISYSLRSRARMVEWRSY